MKILGLSAYYHDSAAALIDDGRIVAAAQEERFTRKKHDAGFPTNAIAYCLGEAAARLGDIDRIVFYDKPLLKFERLLETYLANVPRGFRSFLMSMPVWGDSRRCSSPSTTNRMRHPRSSRARSSAQACCASTASANGRPRRCGWARSIGSIPDGRSTFPIRSACCTRRSPITQVSA